MNCLAAVMPSRSASCATQIALHKAILTAVELGDGGAAQQAMHEHMNVELRIVEEAFPNR